MTFKPTPHPILLQPSAAEVAAYASMNKLKPEDAFVALHKQREKIITQEKMDPLRYGWEPPIWKLCDSLLGFPWVDQALAERIRKRLGFERPVRVLLINGGNRGGKSEYAAKRCDKILASYAAKRGWALHSKEDMSIDYQQPLLWKYLPAEWKTVKAIKSAVAYISYKQQTGFADGKFTLPNGSDLRLFYYSMNRETVEGGNLDIIWPDELVPPDWVETMELRIAEKNGVMIITFTPINGYTPTVALFQDGAETMFSSIGYLLPKDKGPKDVARALGVTEEELAELQLASDEKRAPRCLACRPEDVVARILDESYDPKAAMPAGRSFDLVPRVMKPSAVNDPKGIRATVFFHSSDNPYANPISIVGTLEGKNTDFIKERFYGVGHRLVSAKFPKFNRKVHIVSREVAEAMYRGATKYHVVDPCNGRNFFMLWGGATKDESYIVRREWPGDYPIPEKGMPGPWATTGDEKHLDGKPGPAQVGFGFGYWKYKREIVRLEGWKEYEAGKPEGVEEDDWIIGMDENGEARERIMERIVDSRFASNPKLENDRPSTLITDFEDVGITFKAAPGKAISDSIQKVNDVLDYDPEQPVSALNQPRLFICEDCINLIFAMATWTGADGSKGATKDPIDVLFYWLQSDPIYMEDADRWNTVGGGTY